MTVNPRDRIRRYIEKPLKLEEFLQRPTKLHFAPGFCQALQLEVTGPAVGRNWTVPDNKWAEFPWVTLVLGSGPVGLPDAFWGAVQLLPDLVVETIAEVRYEGNKLGNNFPEKPPQLVRQFLDSLTKERVGDLLVRQATGDRPRVGDLTAALVLLAAQLTRVFHLVSFQSSRPVSRWVSVVAQISRRGDLSELDAEVTAVQVALDFARMQLEAAPLTWAPGQEFTNAVGSLLTAIDENLSSARLYKVSLDHLRA